MRDKKVVEALTGKAKKLAQVKKGGKGKGQKELLAYLSGKKLTAMGSVKAFCYECNGYYHEGTFDCKVDTCPLYPHNPYGAAKEEKKRAKKAVK